MSARDQVGGGGAVALEPLRLEVRAVRAVDLRPLVPVEAEPAQAVENSLDHVVRRAFDVGVFDAQHEDAAQLAREQPVEERGARAADVEVAGGRGSEADARSGHGGMLRAARELAVPRLAFDSLRSLRAFSMACHERTPRFAEPQVSRMAVRQGFEF